MHIISSVMKLKGPDVVGREEKPEKVFKQKCMKEMLGMKMGESQFHTDCKVFLFPPNIISSVCLRTFFAINFN